MVGFASKKVWLSIAFCGSVLMPIFAFAQTLDPAVACASPDAVLDRYIQAVGGREAVDRLKTRIADVRETEPYSFKPQETAAYDYHFEWKAPNKAVARFTHVVSMFGMPAPFAKGHFIFDGEQWSDFQGRFSPKGNEAEFRKRLMFDYPQNAMWRVAADPLMVARPAELYSAFNLANDFNSYPDRCILRAKGTDGRVDLLYFDTATGLLRTWQLQMVQPWRSYYISFQLGDYRRAGEVTFPFYLYCDFYQAAFRYTAVVHNRQLPDRHFALKREIN